MNIQTMASGCLGVSSPQRPAFLIEHIWNARFSPPLGMKSSTLEVASVPKSKLAVGYRHKPDGSYEEEKPLAHGAFGSMGGLLTTAEDFGSVRSISAFCLASAKSSPKPVRCFGPRFAK